MTFPQIGRWFPQRLAKSPATLFTLAGMLVTGPLSFASAAPHFDARGGQFIGLTSLRNFEASRGSRSTETVLTSRIIDTQIKWDELVASWNADTPDGTYLLLEARAIYTARPTKYYYLGRWSTNPARYPRESVPNQADDDGDVKTDTLILRDPAPRLQIRITLGGEGNAKPVVKHLGFSLTNTRTRTEPLPPNRLAWGKSLPVPERSQMNYPNGSVLCSPATVSMILGFWSEALGRPALDRQVPEIESAVYDSTWKGTGNWVFNTAYAGALPGMRAYVARFTDLSELEDWIAQGLPVGLSLCYNRLRGTGTEPSGHLVVCVGFTENGDPIINDPGTRQDVRKVFPRRNLIHAWAYSRNAAYLIYPENVSVPKDRFGHWHSWTSRSRIVFE